jgi:hypothetical protein
LEYIAPWPLPCAKLHRHLRQSALVIVHECQSDHNLDRGLYWKPVDFLSLSGRCHCPEPVLKQPVIPMRAPSTRRKSTIKWTPTLGADIDKKECEDEDANVPAPTGGTPCIAGEFRSTPDTLFETLEETQPWYIFCINPNNSQLPIQLEGRSVKGQVRSIGSTEITRRYAHSIGKRGKHL